MADLVFGIRLTADGSGYVGTVRVAAAETEALSKAAHGASKSVDEQTGSMTKAVAIGSELGRVIGDAARKLLEWAAATVTSAAELKDWADQTGSSVESLSRLSNVAKISGVSMGELQIATQRLSFNLAGTDDESRRTTRALEQLGITTRDPAQAMEQLALKLAQYRDGAEKAALVQDILGRGAQRLLPYLKDLADQQQVGATTSTEQAVAAENLEKSLRALTVQASALRDSILSDLVPAFVELIAQFTSGTRIAGGFWNALNLFSTLPTVKSIADVREAIAGVEREIADSTAKKGNWWDRLFGGADSAIDNATLKLRYLNEQLARFQKADPTLRAQEDRGFDPRQIAPITPARAKAIVDPLEKELDRLQDKWTNLFAAKQTGIDVATVKSLEELDKLLDNGRISWEQYVAGINLALDADKTLAAEQREINRINEDYWKGLDKIDDAEDKRVEHMRKLVETLEDQNDSLRVEIETLGLSRTERELRISQLDRERALKQADNDVERQRINNLYDERDALIAAKGAAEDYLEAEKQAQEQAKQLFSKADDFARQAFGAIFEKGDDAFKRIGESLKHNVVDALYALIVRPWIIQVVASLTGTSAGNLANLVGGAAGGGGINPLSLLTGGKNPLSFLTGGQSLGGAFVTSGAGQALGLSAPVANAAAGSAEAALFGEAGTSVVATEFGATVASTLTAAIPVVGLVLAAAFMSGIFNKKPSEVRGQFGISSGTTGFEDNAYTSSGAGNLGFLDANTQQFSGEAAQVFNKIVGGAIDAFEQRYSPEQRDRLTQALQATTFASQSGTFTTEDFIQQYGGQVLQQVVSAAFDILDPALGSVVRNFHGTADEVAKFGNTLLGIYDATKAINNDTFTATVDTALQGADQATADKVLAFVNIVTTFGDSIAGLGTQLETLDPASITAFIDALGGAQQALSDFAYLYQNFTTSADRATFAQTGLTQAWDAAGVTMDDLARAGLDHLPRTHAEFLRLLESLDLNTEHGRDLERELLQHVAPAFVAVQGTAESAAEALNRQAQAGHDYFTQHFLTPAEQLQQRQTVDSTAIFDATRQTTDLGKALHLLGHDELPLTVDGIRGVRAELVAMYGEGSDVVKQFDAVIPSIGDLIDSVGGFGDATTKAADAVAQATNVIITSVGSIIQQAESAAQTLLGKFSTLAGQSTGDFGHKLSLQIGLIADAIGKADRSQFPSTTAFNVYVGTLKQSDKQLTAELAEFNRLTLQYDAQRAEQLVGLEQWRDEQNQIFKGNADDLAVVQQIFDERWKAIVDGVQTGVDGTLDQLARLQQGIADYLKSLFVGNLSPLTPKQQLDQSQAAYLDDLAKASPSNTDQASRLQALSDITKLADDFLKQAQSYFSAPSQAYRDIFDEVTHDLGGLAGTRPNGLPLPASTNDTVTATTTIANAVPATGEKIASNADIAKQTETMRRIASDSANAASADAAAIIAAVSATSRRTAYALK